MNKTTDSIVDVYPIGTLSHKQEGKDLSEMYDMQQAGAVAFSDDKKTVENAGLLMRALLYAQNFDGLIINPGGYAHTSVAIHDAMKILQIPIIEVDNK